MKKMKQDLKDVNKGLKALVKKTETLMKAVDQIEKSKAAQAKKATPKKKPVAAGKKAPAKKRSAKLTDTGKVLNIIKRSKKGVSAQALSKKTGFNAKKIANIVFKANKEGKIKSVSKGVYVGA